MPQYRAHRWGLITVVWPHCKAGSATPGKHFDDSLHNNYGHASRTTYSHGISNDEHPISDQQQISALDPVLHHVVCRHLENHIRLGNRARMQASHGAQPASAAGCAAHHRRWWVQPYLGTTSFTHQSAGAADTGLAHAIPLATYLLEQQGAGSDVVMPALVQCLASPDIGRGVFSQNKNLQKRCSIMLELMDKCSRYGGSSGHSWDTGYMSYQGAGVGSGLNNAAAAAQHRRHAIG